MRTRSAAYASLFSLISGAFAWKNTPSRKLVLWDDSPKEERPSFFQFEGGDDVFTWTSSPYAKRVIEAKLFVYLDSTAGDGAIQLAAIKDAIDAALEPKGADAQLGKQTLLGTCELCRIEGKIISDPGDLDDDGLLMIPIKITLP